MEAAGFGVTGNINQTGYHTQIFEAPGTNQEYAFTNVQSASIALLDYTNVFQGMANYPGSGRFFQDYFAFRYFDSFAYNFGTSIEYNGQKMQMVQIPSGSGGAGRSELSLKDNFNSSGTALILADDIDIVSRDTFQINDLAGNLIRMNTGQGVFINTPDEVEVSTDFANFTGTVTQKRSHWSGNPFNSDESSNLGAIRFDENNQYFTFTLYDSNLVPSQSIQGMYINTGSNTLENYLQTNYAGTTNELKLKNVGSTRTIDIDTDTFSVTGSANFSDVIKLAEQNPLPSGGVGELAVSASNLYYHNGTSWAQIN